jgi:AraC-like DNA-binding protein
MFRGKSSRNSPPRRLFCLRQQTETAMQRLVLSTDDVPEGERFSYWRAAVRDGLIGVRIERDKDQERPFSGHLIGLRSGSIACSRCRVDGHASFRERRDIAQRSWHDHFFLYREFSAGSFFAWDRTELVTQPGEVVIGDPTVALTAKPRDKFDYELWVLPRNLLDPHLPSSRRPRSLVLNGSDGMDRMVKAYLDAFAAQFMGLDDGGVDLVADNFCRLLAVACGSNAGEHQEALRQGRLEEAKRYVGLHLADPALTPEKTASALKISVRQLHKLFEPTATSFAQYVLTRRLEECRAALTNSKSERSVTDIAFAWGFNSLATFHRNFRQTFGATPGELRGKVDRVG